MLSLDQLISEAIALPDAAKALLIDRIVESMSSQIEPEVAIERVKKAQERIADRLWRSPNNSWRCCFSKNTATLEEVKSDREIQLTHSHFIYTTQVASYNLSGF